MKQKREPQNRPTRIWPTVLKNEAKTAFATNGTGIAGHPHAKKKKWIYTQTLNPSQKLPQNGS